MRPLSLLLLALSSSCAHQLQSILLSPDLRQSEPSITSGNPLSPPLSPSRSQTTLPGMVGQNGVASSSISSSSSTPIIEFSKHWKVLGPWQIGTREAAWGADPTEQHGGFRSLEYSESATFPSSLGFNGTIGWTRRYLQQRLSSEPNTFELPIKIGFPDVDFESLRAVYGWSAIQFQAWIRTDFIVNGKQRQRLLLFTDGILEFRVDDKHYFGGDFFSFRHAPTAIWVEPGQHRLEVRLIRDVRSMGGSGPPEISCQLTFNVLGNKYRRLAAKAVVVPDFLEGRGFAGKYASIRLRNDWTNSLRPLSVKSRSENISVSLQGDRMAIDIAPGQTREIPLLILATTRSLAGTAGEGFGVEIRFGHKGKENGHSNLESSVVVLVEFNVRNIGDAHKMTYLHPSGAVSYAILEPPIQTVDHNESVLPVLLNLHGAGLEVDSDEVRAIFRNMKPLPFWIVHPSGMTPWSGDDWHSWGYADAEAAVEAIGQWVKLVDWEGPTASAKSYHLIGHSNGGQGVWYGLTHRPDKVLTAAAVSGYTSIEQYVPYQFWSAMSPGAAMILNAARLSYRHELLAGNFADINITQQHGSADDNVPPYHSRNMYQLAAQSQGQAAFLELPGKGHWYEGVMETYHLKGFYANIQDIWKKQSHPGTFKLTATPNGDAGMRENITVEQMIVPHELGEVEIEWSMENTRLEVNTSNVRCFSVNTFAQLADISRLVIDGQRVQPVRSVQKAEGRPTYVHSSLYSPDYYVQDDDGKWSGHIGPITPLRRSRDQLGGMDSLLRTNQTIDIVPYSSGQTHIANQLAQNFYQYFRADSRILHARSYGEAFLVSVDVRIHLVTGPITTFLDPLRSPNPASPAMFLEEQRGEIVHPIEFVDGRIKVSIAGGRTQWYNQEAGTALYFLTPGRKGRIEVVVWGHGLKDLQKVARLLPTTTGVGQPDFVILGKESAWKGAGGVKAMGYFDHNWKVAAGSYVT